jgi:hypothetical protein
MNTRSVPLAYQPPTNSIFLSEQTSHHNQPAVLFSQNKPAPDTSQTNMLTTHTTPKKPVV